MDNLGDSFMFLSGAPVETHYHACYVADMGLDMLKHCEDVVSPLGQYVQIRIGESSLYGITAPFKKINH